MLGPDSRLLTALLVVASVALLVAAIRYRLLPVKVLCGGLSIVIAMTGGIAAVNYYYGYYTSWGQLWADFHGGTGDLGAVSATTTTTTQLESGRIGWVTLPGKLSGYSRRGLLYLPPQYGQARYAHVRFPVVELFHGTPGSPVSWDTVLRISQVADSLIARHIIGPMVLVMPAINGAGRHYQDCVNAPAISDDTYLTQDVRADVFARYRVSHDPYEWGVTGYSSGGYCAANLALRHRRSFGAAAVIEGYFRAADGPAATRAEPQPAPGGRQQPAVPRGAAHPGQRPPAGLLGRGRVARHHRLPNGERVHRRARPHGAGPVLQAQRRRLRQRLAGRPAHRPGLALAAARTTRPARPVPGPHHGRRHRHPAGHPRKAASPRAVQGRRAVRPRRTAVRKAGARPGLAHPWRDDGQGIAKTPAAIHADIVKNHHVPRRIGCHLPVRHAQGGFKRGRQR